MTDEDIEKEIRRMKEEIRELEETESLENEKNKVEGKLNKLKFKQKHKGLLNFTQKLEKGTIGFFKGMGTALKKSDDAILKQKIKEKEMNKKVKLKRTSKDEIKDELNFMD